ncbi:Rpn family recombination-promoting nuclease/putative transposase [Arsenophonus nasoniae]|uniref:Rpn family recombination-promoting nuclease/putative transposase n=1 Tax=Arsenophonus nasoniae TaxID=638 RepID=A0AA95G9J2_9GAMM|nr:Rpn family recombination-promoting nuclease/putative transposase [Arsenophonus nasoniae]WGL93997.1 Rpn family recombination-promoting nuclease/putative transposase [Arsenophonus nasoniae]
MTKKFTPTPHDAVFRQFLHEKETAQDFFAIWLPNEIKAFCNLSTLKAESCSFIDEDMKGYQSDILYSVSTTKGDGYFYLLIEHQSTPDKLIAWRLMRYSMAAMQRHLDAGHKKLPLVFPILFYCGEKSPHPYSTNWLECFEDVELAKIIYNQPFNLADITTLDDGEIMQHRRIALLELIQKHIRRRDMTELLNEIVKLISYNYYTDNQVITMMNYLIQEGNAEKPLQFITEIAKRSEKHEGVLMTIAQQIEEIGIQKGKLEGLHEASINIATQMLKSGMDKQSVMTFTGLTKEQIDNLCNLNN